MKANEAAAVSFVQRIEMVLEAVIGIDVALASIPPGEDVYARIVYIHGGIQEQN